jgi:hypothetical protein
MKVKKLRKKVKSREEGKSVVKAAEIITLSKCLMEEFCGCFSGVGIILITVSGVAWRLTAHDASSCPMMLGLGGGDEGGAEPNRRFVPRLPPSYGRPHHPCADT